VHKYTFPGKTADEIEKEINFDNLKTIPSHIIIHVGTNNLPLETATECAQKIEKLATKCKEIISLFENWSIWYNGAS
jgi:hypothetical protein